MSEAKRKWREKNRELLKAKGREYYWNNVERQKLKGKIYRERFPEKSKERCIKWIRNNPEKAMLGRAKARAKRKGIEFNISLEDISIPTHCPVLKIPLARANGKMHDNSPSLDRIDCTKGYVRGNIIVISWRANMIKSVGRPDELIKIGNFFHHLEWCAKQGQHIILSSPTNVFI